MSQKIKAKEVNPSRLSIRPVEVAVGGADASYADTREAVTLLSVFAGGHCEREVVLEAAAARELATRILANLDQCDALREAA